MLKNLVFFISALLFIDLSADGQDNPPAWDYLNMPSQPSVYLNIQLGKQHENFMDGQAYVGVINNVSADEVHVTGTIVAYLTCGNQVSSSFDVTLKPGDAAGGGTPALLNADGLGGHAMNTDCQGVKKYPDPANNPTYWYYDRIRTVGITNLQVTVISDNNSANNGSTVANNNSASNNPVIAPTNNSNLNTGNTNANTALNAKQAQMQQFNQNLVNGMRHGNTETTEQINAELATGLVGLVSAIVNHGGQNVGYPKEKNKWEGYSLEEDIKNMTPGELYFKAQVFEADNHLDEANKYYHAAAENGYQQGYYAAGQVYAYKKIYDKAFTNFLYGANHGDTICMSSVAELYLNGLGIEKNYVEALKWYEKTSDTYTNSCYQIYGIYLIGGYGVPIDNVKAELWKKKWESSEWSIKDMQNSIDKKFYYRLAEYYMNGKLMNKDYSKALAYLIMAVQEDQADLINPNQEHFIKRIDKKQIERYKSQVIFIWKTGGYGIEQNELMVRKWEKFNFKDPIPQIEK